LFPYTTLFRSSAARADHPLRPISFGTPAVHVERRDDGTIYLRPKTRLRDYPVRLTDRLHHWAAAAPDRVFMAERNAARGWRGAFRPRSRSSSYPAIRSIMHWWRLARSMRAFPSVRYRRPIRWCRGTTASSAI